MTLLTAAYVAQALAALSAVALARRRPSHLPAAVALVLLAVVAFVDGPIAAALPPAVEPWHGWHRVLVYLDGAINIGTSAILAGLAVAVAVAREPPRRRRMAVGAVVAVWALASVVLAALYPSPLVRDQGLHRVYFAADLIGLFVATVALVTEARADIAAKRSPTVASMVALMLALTDAGILLAPFLPWRGALFGADYGGVQFLIALSFATIAIVQVYLWSTSSR